MKAIEGLSSGGKEGMGNLGSKDLGTMCSSHSMGKKS